MTSFNHFALGAVADWIHRTVGGLAPLDPGYRRISFAPRPGGGLAHAAAEHETPYGRAAIAWRIDAGELRVEVRVPTGATGVVDLPDGRTFEVGSGVHAFGTPMAVAVGA
jgi:alpha-L-rhamnosidase